MNTPSHLILNLCALGGRDPATAALPVAIGAVLPDAPMFVFYGVEKWRGVPEEIIWTTDYFAPAWQDFFDVFNSIPILLFGLALAWRWRNRFAQLVFASMGLHAVMDGLLHHDDAHRHFFPLSDWRFASPVSYWDPAHHGWIAAPLEIAMALAGCLFLVRRHPTRRARVALGFVAASYASFIAFALATWG